MLHLRKPELAPEETDRQVRESAVTMLDDIAHRVHGRPRARLRRCFQEKEWDFEVYDRAKY
jgi:hypothetical protein